jgi:hypothetical protein
MPIASILFLYAANSSTLPSTHPAKAVGGWSRALIHFD